MGTRILHCQTCFACPAEGLGFCATLVFLKLILGMVYSNFRNLRYETDALKLSKKEVHRKFVNFQYLSSSLQLVLKLIKVDFVWRPC